MRMTTSSVTSDLEEVEVALRDTARSARPAREALDVGRELVAVGDHDASRRAWRRPRVSSGSTVALCSAKRGSRLQVGALARARHRTEPHVAVPELGFDAADARRAVGAERRRSSCACARRTRSGRAPRARAPRARRRPTAPSVEQLEHALRRPRDHRPVADEHHRALHHLRVREQHVDDLLAGLHVVLA